MFTFLLMALWSGFLLGVIAHEFDPPGFRAALPFAIFASLFVFLAYFLWMIAAATDFVTIMNGMHGKVEHGIQQGQTARVF